VAPARSSSDSTNNVNAGCHSRLVLRCIDSIRITRPQKGIKRLRLMLARCRPWSEFGVNHDSMTILNCHHKTQNPVLRSTHKCSNPYQAHHAVASNPKGRQHVSLTNQQRKSAPYRGIHEKGPLRESESSVRFISSSSSFFRRTSKSTQPYQRGRASITGLRLKLE
jgi:hypothetical protein